MTSKQDFSHSIPELRLHHGASALDRLAPELDRLGCTRAVVLCGASLSRDAAAMDRVQKALGDRCAGVSPTVRAHSPLPSIHAAADCLKELRADAVIALGGGSAIVTARAAAIVLAEASDIKSLSTRRMADGTLYSPRLRAPKLAQLVIPTTPTTAIVKAGSAVLDPASLSRLALFDPKTRARAVFVDAALVTTPPLQVVVSAALNTMTMAVEGLCSKRGNPLSDALLTHALRMLKEQLLACCSRDCSEVRSQLVWASILCGQGTDITGAGIAIPLGHALSTHFNLDNGVANAIVLPHVLRFNSHHIEEGIRKIAMAWGLATDQSVAAMLESIIDTLQALATTLSVSTRLRDVGIPFADFEIVANTSIDDWFSKDNPRPVQHSKELEELLGAAW